MRQLSGALASHVSTVEAARDIDVLRAALGERVTSYFGFSYGTELGATYAELFPGRVGRFVLDGAVDPSARRRARRRSTQAEGFETALRAYVANCLDVTDSCFLGDSVDEGMQRIRDFLDQVDEQPLTDHQRPRAHRRAGALRHRDAALLPRRPGSCSARRCGRRSTATARR